MTEPENPMRLIQKLAERLEVMVNDMGLELHGVMVVPGLNEHQPDVLQAVFVIQAEAIDPKDPEQTKIDTEFEAMVGTFSEDTNEVDTAVQDAKSLTEKWLKGEE